MRRKITVKKFFALFVFRHIMEVGIQKQGGDCVDFNPAKVLKEFYSKPIYISSHATSLAIEFVPKGSQPAIATLKHFDGDQRRALEKEYYEKCGSFEFVIHKMRSKEQPIKIHLNCWDIRELISVIDSAEDRSWISTAEVNLGLTKTLAFCQGGTMPFPS